MKFGIRAKCFRFVLFACAAAGFLRSDWRICMCGPAGCTHRL